MVLHCFLKLNHSIKLEHPLPFGLGILRKAGTPTSSQQMMDSPAITASQISPCGWPPQTHGYNRNNSLSFVRLRCANRTYNGFANAATIFSTLWVTDRVALSSTRRSLSQG